jgi:cell fate regulator YaaT (PSP1 superfamily)
MSEPHLEYLLGYGLAGDFGRFRASRPLGLWRGDRAVLRTHRGLEIGRVLREATPRHALFLPNTTVGQLLRLATEEDDRAEERLRARAQELFARAGDLARELGLPLEVLDAEVLLDGEHGVVHHLVWEQCDVRPLVSTLSRAFELHIALTDLARREAEEPAGCGKEGCGSGGCGSCGSGGGCGSCGSGDEELREHFARLREQMERHTAVRLL